MDYSDIKSLALSYADREDSETIDRLDDFMRIVEARINRIPKVREMAFRATILTVEDQEYYGLPVDFAGLRDIEIADENTTLQYLSPEQMNGINRDRTDCVFYTIVANQLQIAPPQDGKTLEVVYYQKLSALTETEMTNWLSDSSPDAYVFGLLVEISSFVKDKETASLWDARFKETIDSIVVNDDVERWSGTALRVRVG